MLESAQVYDAIGQAMQRYRVSPEQLQELQQRKLRKLLRHAVDRSPFYQKLYGSIDVDRAPLTELPTVNKSIIMENFDDVVTDRRLKLADVKRFCQTEPDLDRPWLLDAFAAMLSSGTSGEKGYFVMDGAALADAMAMGVRQSTGGGRIGGQPNQSGAAGSSDKPAQPEHRFAAVMLIEPFDSAGILVRMIPEHLGPKKLIDNRLKLSQVVEQLNEFQPTLVSSFPYTLRLLAEEARAGKLKISPKRITSSGDVLTASDRAAVETTFGVQVFDYYCCTEATYLAWECEAHEGLHLNADFSIVESVDDANQPVPDGRLGAKILVTNLSNRLMPLIRYEIADQVEFMPESKKCPCGCTLPRIRTVAGRVEEIIKLPAAGGGTVSLIPEQIDEFLGRLPSTYQVIQEAPSRLTINYVVLPEADATKLRGDIDQGISHCFEEYGVQVPLEIDLRQVEALEPVQPGSTKICHYWNRSR